MVLRARQVPSTYHQKEQLVHQQAEVGGALSL